MKPKTYEDLSKLIKMNGGVMNVTMGDLRDINGSDRLGNNILSTIDEKLREHGIGCSDLESKHWKTVRLYSIGTAIEKIINAVADISDESNDCLRQFANNDLAKALRAVKDAVCDLKI